MYARAPPPSNKIYSRAALRFYADLHLLVRAQYDNIHGGVRAIGPQVLGRVGKATISAPVYGFGTAERKHVRKVFISTAHQKTDMHGLDSPGPAAPYNFNPAIGKQFEAKIESSVRAVFEHASAALSFIFRSLEPRALA